MNAKKILIADDDPKMRSLYRQTLGAGYDYLEAENGVDALILAVDNVPDLILLDIMMPILDGRTICRRLKNYPKTAGIRILIISGRTEQNDRIVGLEAGADEYLTKPISLVQLTSLVTRLLP